MGTCEAVGIVLTSREGVVVKPPSGPTRVAGSSVGVASGADATTVTGAATSGAASSLAAGSADGLHPNNTDQASTITIIFFIL